MNDWRGTEVKVGDRVVYPGRHSSSMWNVEAEVVELIEGNPDAKNYWDQTPHQLRVKRLRESGYGGKVKSVEPKVVPVLLGSVTVVETTEALEMARYPLRYIDMPSGSEIDGGPS